MAQRIVTTAPLPRGSRQCARRLRTVVVFAAAQPSSLMSSSARRLPIASYSYPDTHSVGLYCFGGAERLCHPPRPDLSRALRLREMTDCPLVGQGKLSCYIPAIALADRRSSRRSLVVSCRPPPRLLSRFSCLVPGGRGLSHQLLLAEVLSSRLYLPPPASQPGRRRSGRTLPSRHGRFRVQWFFLVQQAAIRAHLSLAHSKLERSCFDLYPGPPAPLRLCSSSASFHVGVDVLARNPKAETGLLAQNGLCVDAEAGRQGRDSGAGRSEIASENGAATKAGFSVNYLQRETKSGETGL